MEGNKNQAAALDWVEQSVFLGDPQRLVMRGYGSGNLTGCKLKLWYKLASMSEDRYPRRVFKPHRGRQSKVSCLE